MHARNTLGTGICPKVVRKLFCMGPVWRVSSLRDVGGSWPWGSIQRGTPGHSLMWGEVGFSKRLRADVHVMPGGAWEELSCPVGALWVPRAARNTWCLRFWKMNPLTHWCPLPPAGRRVSNVTKGRQSFPLTHFPRDSGHSGVPGTVIGGTYLM